MIRLAELEYAAGDTARAEAIYRDAVPILEERRAGRPGAVRPAQRIRRAAGGVGALQ
jgi:hypothetical protein